MLENLYGHRGFEFIHVTTFAAASSGDDFWADAFKRFGGHVTLSGDGRIAYKPHQAIAFLDNGFLAFFCDSPWSEMPGHLKAAHLAFWWPTIEEKIREGDASCCWRIPCEAKRGADNRRFDLRLTLAQIHPLRIPADVIEKAREARDANRTVQARGSRTGRGREQAGIRGEAAPDRSAPTKARRKRNGRQGTLI
jgi:hypothetical protein